VSAAVIRGATTAEPSAAVRRDARCAFR